MKDFLFQNPLCSIGLAIAFIIVFIVLINNTMKKYYHVKNEKALFSYIDKHNLLNKRLSFGVVNESKIKARYLQLYGSLESPLTITGIFINGIEFPFCYLGLKTLTLEKTPDDSYKIVKLDLGRELDISKIEVHCDPVTTKSLKSFKILLRDSRQYKVWESSDFLKPVKVNIINVA